MNAVLPRFVFLIMVFGFGSAVRAESLDLSQCYGPYRIQPFVKVAAALQAMQEEARIAQLREWVASRDEGLSGYFSDEQILLLCGMLFERIPGREFRSAGRGVPGFIGQSGRTLTNEQRAQLWPDEPFVFIDDVPFYVVSGGYILAGMRESPEHFLNRCLKEARWTTRDYAKVKPEDLPKALERLINTYSRPALLSAEDKAYLADQLKPYAVPRLSSGVRIAGGQQSTEISTSTDGRRLGPLEKLWVTVYGGVRPYHYILRNQQDDASVVLEDGTGPAKPENPYVSQEFPLPWKDPVAGSLLVFEVEDAKGTKLTQRIKVIDAKTVEVFASIFFQAPGNPIPLLK